MATMKEKLFLLSAIIIFFYNGFGSALQTEILPNVISPKTQTVVMISCIPDDEIDDDADDVLTMELRKDNTPIVTIRHESEIHYTQGMEKRFQTKGRLDRIAGQSYLRASLLHPKEEDAGRYECIMFYLDPAGVLKQKAAVANLSFTDGHETDQNKITDLEIQLKNLQDQLDAQTRKENDRPVFSAKYTRWNRLKTGGIIVFNEILVSEGIAGYDGTSGIFTAPMTGVYNFEVSAAMGKTGGFLNIDVLVNNQVQAGLTAADKDFDDQSAVSFMVKLLKGTEVKAVLRARSNSSITVNSANGWTFFSGYLVK